MFSFPDAGLLKLLKIKNNISKKKSIFSQIFSFLVYFFKEKKFQFDEFHWNSVIWYVKYFWYVKYIWYVKYKSGFSPVRQDLSAKFGCPVLSGEKTHMPSPVEP